MDSSSTSPIHIRQRHTLNHVIVLDILFVIANIHQTSCTFAWKHFM